MKILSLKNLAAVSAVALGAALYTTAAYAVAVQSGVASSVGMTATITNTLTVITTPLSFGSIGAVRKAADQATATVAPGAVIVTAGGDDGGGVSTNARILADSANPPSTASVTVTAFASTPIYVDYGTIVDLTSGGETFTITHLLDNLNAPDTGVAGTAGNWDIGGGAGTIQGIGTTTAGGSLVFHIGGSIRTTASNAVYANGVYTGSFNVTLSY